MNNAVKAALLVAAGAAGGFAGNDFLKSIPGTYEAHAVDLRLQREKLPDAGMVTSINVQAWGARVLADGGYKDVGGGACDLTDPADIACEKRLMKSASSCIHE